LSCGAQTSECLIQSEAPRPQGGASREGSFVHIVPLPACRQGSRLSRFGGTGHVPAKFLMAVYQGLSKTVKIMVDKRSGQKIGAKINPNKLQQESRMSFIRVREFRLRACALKRYGAQAWE